MKVDKIPVFTIVTHKNVLVEKEIKGLQTLPSVPVYNEFNYKALIGIAHVNIKRGNVYADIHLLGDIQGYPAIAYKNHNGQIYAIGISAKPNIDKDIQRIRAYLVQPKQPLP